MARGRRVDAVAGAVAPRVDRAGDREMGVDSGRQRVVERQRALGLGGAEADAARDVEQRSNPTKAWLVTRSAALRAASRRAAAARNASAETRGSPSPPTCASLWPA